MATGPVRHDARHPAARCRCGRARSRAACLTASPARDACCRAGARSDAPRRVSSAHSASCCHAFAIEAHHAIEVGRVRLAHRAGREQARRPGSRRALVEGRKFDALECHAPASARGRFFRFRCRLARSVPKVESPRSPRMADAMGERASSVSTCRTVRMMTSSPRSRRRQNDRRPRSRTRTSAVYRVRPWAPAPRDRACPWRNAGRAKNAPFDGVHVERHEHEHQVPGRHGEGVQVARLGPTSSIWNPARRPAAPMRQMMSPPPPKNASEPKFQALPSRSSRG